jgi:hypothetical protein
MTEGCKYCHIELAELLFNRQSQISTNPFKTEDASTTVQHDNIFCHSEFCLAKCGYLSLSRSSDLGELSFYD